MRVYPSLRARERVSIDSFIQRSLSEVPLHITARARLTLYFQGEVSAVCDLSCTDIVGGHAAVLTRVRRLKVTQSEH